MPCHACRLAVRRLSQCGSASQCQVVQVRHVVYMWVVLASSLDPFMTFYVASYVCVGCFLVHLQDIRLLARSRPEAPDHAKMLTLCTPGGARSGQHAHSSRAEAGERAAPRTQVPLITH